MALRPSVARFFSTVKMASSTLKAVICPSMLSSDFANLASEAKRMIDNGADWLHMDVMVRMAVLCAKHFVSNVSSTAGRVCIRVIATLALDLLLIYTIVADTSFQT